MNDNDGGLKEFFGCKDTDKRKSYAEGKGRPQETTGDYGRPQEITGNAGHLEATAGNGRQREATGGNGRQRQATAGKQFLALSAIF